MLDESYPVGMLTDTDIKKALHVLFSEHADAVRAKYSTYEIVLDKGFQVIQYSNAGEVERLDRSPENGIIAVAPGETVLVFSKEYFSLPHNVYARVNTVGQIFLAGFSAENTYVDPGFQGQISITLINNSSRVLSMEQGAPLARVEFIKLSKKPERTHSGRKGVRESKVVPSIDSSSADTYKALDLLVLLKQIETSISVEAIQKKSIRTDIALTRAYIKLAEEVGTSREQIRVHDETFNLQDKLLKRSQRLAAFALATAVALWLDKLGFTQWVVQSITTIGSDNTKPTYWLNVVVNITCSVAATPIFSFLLGRYQNARTKKK
ncbi:dCTP deaminase domain-containing protein [Pseudomonas fluorescens]|uniref:dCTP deaminase domain-containing protein n=1 Tax=Pseudomonas fluorescens TaxID=294 RepID=UPI0009BB3F57|nr:hypothetical protein [Pseudomonas fluorescens]